MLAQWSLASLSPLGSSSCKVGFGLLTAEWSQGVDELLTKWLASKRQKARPPGQLRTVSEHGIALLPLCSSSQSSPQGSWLQRGGWWNTPHLLMGGVAWWWHRRVCRMADAAWPTLKTMISHSKLVDDDPQGSDSPHWWLQTGLLGPGTSRNSRFPTHLTSSFTSKSCQDSLI